VAEILLHETVNNWQASEVSEHLSNHEN